MNTQTEETQNQIGRHLTGEDGVIGRGSMKGDEYVRALYVRYRRGLDRTVVEEKVGVEGHTYPEFAKYGKGKAKGRMTVELAAEVRKAIIRGEIQPTRERREEAKQTTWTIDRLWTLWLEDHAENGGKQRDDWRYGKHLKKTFGPMEPSEIKPPAIERLKRTLRDGEYADDSIISTVSLLRRIANYGMKNQLCQGLTFKPNLDGLHPKKRTERMDAAQTEAYRKVCREFKNPQIGNLCLLGEQTGIRKSNLRDLRWSDVDLKVGFVRLAETKTGKEKHIVLSDLAKGILAKHLEQFPGVGDAFVFRGCDTHVPGRLSDRQIRDGVEAIRDAANLPDFDGKKFRPLHGLRHSLGSRLVSNGATLFDVQNVLGHDTPSMAARYSHMAPERLQAVLNSANKGNAEQK